MALGLKIGFRNTFAVSGSEIMRKTRPLVRNTMFKRHGLLNHYISYYSPPLS